MTDTEFWNLIDRSRSAAKEDPFEQMERLAEELGALPTDEIVTFERIFQKFHQRAYDWGVWGAAYLIGGGCSDDGFMDFRGWLISRGQQVYENARRDPETLVDVVDLERDADGQAEGFQYLAQRVWSEKTGGDTIAWESQLDSPPIARPEPTGTGWTEEDLPQRFPRLDAMFGEGAL